MVERPNGCREAAPRGGCVVRRLRSARMAGILGFMNDAIDKGNAVLRDAKAQVRAQAKVARAAIDPAERKRKSHVVCAELCDLALRCERERDAGGCGAASLAVALYAAMGSEVSLDELARFAYARGWRVCFPAMVQVGDAVTMRFLAVDQAAYKRKDAAFFAHPARAIPEGSAELAGFASVALEGLDFMVVPMVAFDDAGMRLGYGGGNYDRALAGLRPDACAVGAAFTEQRVACVPAEPHDRALERIVRA